MVCNVKFSQQRGLTGDVKRANIERIEIQEIPEILPEPKKLPSQTFAQKFERTIAAIQQEKGNLNHDSE